MSRHRMVVLWSVVATVCAALMVALPGSETVPYHIAWASFALCFGLEQWSARSTWVGLGAFTVVTGAILIVRAATGVLDWQETAEIPLMLLLIALMIWHVRRRQQALSDLTALAARERAEASDAGAAHAPHLPRDAFSADDRPGLSRADDGPDLRRATSKPASTSSTRSSNV